MSTRNLTKRKHHKPEGARCRSPVDSRLFRGADGSRALIFIKHLQADCAIIVLHESDQTFGRSCVFDGAD
jgi:hypothetical protein